MLRHVFSGITAQKTSGALLMLAVSTQSLSAATVKFNHDTGFSFASTANLAPNDSSVTLRAVAEEMQDGSVLKSCQMTSFKNGEMVAKNGDSVRDLVATGLSVSEAFDQLQAVPREIYRAQAQYIIVSDSEGTENDFVRIQGGAPLNPNTIITIDSQEISPEYIKHEENGYTVKITDPETVERFKLALAGGAETIDVFLNTSRSDYFISASFKGNTDITQNANDCMKNLAEMDIQPSSELSFDLLDPINGNIDAQSLLGSHCGYKENSYDYGSREIGATSGFMLPSHIALQNNSQISMSDYFSYNLDTGRLDLSRSMLQNQSHDVTSCMGDFAVTSAPRQGGDSSMIVLAGLSSPSGLFANTPHFSSGTPFFGGGGGGGGSTIITPPTPTPIPAPMSLLLLASGLAAFGMVRTSGVIRSRRQPA